GAHLGCALTLRRPQVPDASRARDRRFLHRPGGMPLAHSGSMYPSQARAYLLGEHDQLHTLLSTALALNERGDLKARPPLERLVVELRRAFAAHNASEEKLLLPLLTLGDAWSEQRIERMLEEHREEHAAFARKLARDTIDLAPILGDLAAEL